MKFLGKMHEILNVTYDDIKSDLKTKHYTLFRQHIFWNIFLGLSCRIYFFLMKLP